MPRASRIGRLALLCAVVASVHAAAAAQAVVRHETVTGADAPAPAPTVVLAGPRDPYRSLAEEIARRESIPLADTLEAALAVRAAYLLWVVSPASLSDRVMVSFSLALDHAEPRVAAGLITGSTIEQARALYERAARAGGSRAYEVVGAHVLPAQIVTAEAGRLQSHPLTSRAEVLAVLQQADYVHYSGHGGNGYWRLTGDVRLGANDVPELPPIVVSAFSCQTARIWQAGSIALRMVDRGAAAYSGFYYSPMAGFQIGEYHGLPFRYTFPAFPIGAAILAVNEGARTGYARVAFHVLLGDPRISLQPSAPYLVTRDAVDGDTRTVTAQDLPSGIVPLRVPAGDAYHFVEVAGLGGHWQHQPFFDRRIQMTTIGGDRFVLLEHPGGDLDLRLRTRPPLAWLLTAPVVAALDENLVVLADRRHGVDVIAVALGLLGAGLVLWRVRRKRELSRLLLPAVTTGLTAAVLHGVYAFARQGEVAVTTKPVSFNPVAVFGTLLLCSSGAWLFLSAKTWRGRVAGVATATLVAWVGAGVTAGIPAVTNWLIGARADLDVGIYNYAASWRILVFAVPATVVVAATFTAARRIIEGSGRAGWMGSGRFTDDDTFV